MNYTLILDKAQTKMVSYPQAGANTATFNIGSTCEHCLNLGLL